MTRGVRWYLVGSFVLVSLAGCGRGFFSAEREPWRAEAEIACLKSGAVKESAEIVRIDPISGPGMCGADYPLKVAALGESFGSFGFADEDLRPPAAIGNQPRWPIQGPRPPSPQNPTYPQASTYPQAYPQTAVRAGGYAPSPGAPISLTAPGVPPDEDEINLPPEGVPGATQPITRGPYPAAQAYPPAGPQNYPPPRLGPAQGNPVTAVGPVAVKPVATLACPIVSALDRWLADSVQPAAMRWFGARVVEIKQISAYSCRGMNGNPSAHISEHAFGNALDIAAFTLADGRAYHRQGRLEGHAGRAGLSARRAGRRLPAVHDRAGAGLQRLSLRPHPRRSDAPRLASRRSASPRRFPARRSRQGQGRATLMRRAHRS